MRIFAPGIIVLSVIWAPLAIASPAARESDVVAQIEEAVANVREKFPGEVEERLGSFRLAYFRLAGPAKIDALIEQDQRMLDGAAPVRWIDEWQATDPSAGIAIRNAAQIFGLPENRVRAITTQLAVSVFQTSAWEQGKQLVELARPESFSERQWMDIVVANAQADRFDEAEKYFANVKLPVSIDDGRHYAFLLGRAGFVSGVRRIAESYDGEKNVALTFAAAINGASFEQQADATETLIRQLTSGSIRQINIERLIEGRGESWSIHDCKPGIKRIRAPYVASQAQYPPIADCFPRRIGLVPGLAIAAFRAGKRELAIDILDQGSTALLKKIPWDDAELVTEVRWGKRRPTREEVERVTRYEFLVSSLTEMASVAGTIESPEIARKLLPTFQEKQWLNPSLLFAFRNSPNDTQNLLSILKDGTREAWWSAFLELAIKQNKANEAVDLFRAAFAKTQDRPRIFWMFYEQFRIAPNEATEAIKNWYINYARAIGAKPDERSFEVWAFRDFAFEIGDLSLFKELSIETAKRRKHEMSNGSRKQHPRDFALNLGQAALDCLQADRNFVAESLIEDEKDEARRNYFQAYLVDAYAQTDQFDKAGALLDKMSLQYPDVRFYPDYLREAWGHLAYHYARQGRIKEAVAVIGEGKAGKRGGTIDAIVDVWIAAGHYKRP